MRSSRSVQGAYTAQRLSSARFVEIAGMGHLALRGGGDRIQSEIQEFLTGVWQTGGWEESESDRMLATVLFTDIVDATCEGDRARRPALE